MNQASGYNKSVTQTKMKQYAKLMYMMQRAEEKSSCFFLTVFVSKKNFINCGQHQLSWALTIKCLSKK